MSRAKSAIKKAMLRFSNTRFQNGADPDLKAFARHTLPKIEDHLQRALRLAEGNAVSETSRE